MQLLNSLLALVIKIKHKLVDSMLADPVACQDKLMHAFVEAGKSTLFGKDHFFSEINNYEDFKQRVPLRNYEQLLPYIEK